MKKVIIQKLNSTKKKLTAENALEIIRNTTAGEKATGRQPKRVALAPKENKKREPNTKKCNYCYRNTHMESECFNKPGGKFNLDRKQPIPEKNPKKRHLNWKCFQSKNRQPCRRLSSHRSKGQKR